MENRQNHPPTTQDTGKKLDLSYLNEADLKKMLDDLDENTFKNWLSEATPEEINTFVTKVDAILVKLDGRSKEAKALNTFLVEAQAIIEDKTGPIEKDSINNPEIEINDPLDIDVTGVNSETGAIFGEVSFSQEQMDAVREIAERAGHKESKDISDLPEVKIATLGYRIKQLDAKMDEIDSPFSDEFKELATENNALDAELANQIKKWTKDFQKQNSEASTAEIMRDIHLISGLDNPPVYPHEIRERKVEQTSISIITQEKAIESILKRLEGLEVEGLEQESNSLESDISLEEIINSLNSDAMALAHAWTEKQSYSHLSLKSKRTQELAKKLYNLDLLSEEDAAIVIKKESTYEHKQSMKDIAELGETEMKEIIGKNEDVAYREEINSDLKKLNETENKTQLEDWASSDADEDEWFEEDELFEKPIEALSSEDVMHTVYEEMRKMIANNDPRIELIKDDVIGLLNFSRDEITQPQKGVGGFFKKATNFFFGTPSRKEQRMSQVMEAYQLFAPKMRQPNRQRGESGRNAISKAQKEASKTMRRPL